MLELRELDNNFRIEKIEDELIPEILGKINEMDKFVGKSQFFANQLIKLNFEQKLGFLKWEMNFRKNLASPESVIVDRDKKNNMLKFLDKKILSNFEKLDWKNRPDLCLAR